MCNKASSYLDDWKEAKTLYGENLSIPVLAAGLSRSAPPAGHLKCNVDASFSNTNGLTGWGLCIRTDSGEFVTTKMLWQSPCL